VAAPMPLAAPVTMATLSCRRAFMPPLSKPTTEESLRSPDCHEAPSGPQRCSAHVWLPLSCHSVASPIMFDK
jgi:hypothetical protein